MGVLLVQSLISARMKAYGIANAALFDGSTGYLSRTAGTADNPKKFTFFFTAARTQFGVEKTILSAVSGGKLLLRWTAGNQLYARISQSGTEYARTTDAVFRDTAFGVFAWVVDTTKATAAERNRLYQFRRGDGWTELPTAGADIPQNADVQGIGDGSSSQYLGAVYSGGVLQLLPDYLAQCVMLDGVADVPTNGVYADVDGSTSNPIIKAPGNLSFGADGWWLDFFNASGLGEDQSGNGNDWTVNGTITQVTSTPTNRYDTMNPLDQSGGATTENGNRRFVGVAGNATMRGTIAIPPSGVWYYEFRAGNGNVAGVAVGFKKAKAPITRTTDLGNDTDASTIGGRFGSTGSNSKAAYDGTQYDFGGVYNNTVRFGVEVDFDNNTIKHWAGTTLLSTITGCAFDASDAWLICAQDDNGSIGTSETVDFYISEDEMLNKATNSPTSLTICTDNLPKQPGNIRDHMTTVTYSGDSTYPRQFSANHSVELALFKSRSNAYDNILVSSLRGTGNTYGLVTNSTAVEGVDSGNFNVSSFDSDGITMAAPSSTDIINASGTTGVVHMFSLPSSETNTDGDISVDWICNASFGMAVGKYTGDGTTATLGLPTINGKAPGVVVVKRTDGADDWYVYHKALGGSAYALLNSAVAATTGSSVPWGGTAPTVSVVTINSAANVSSATYEILCFWETDYCKIGSYEGNASSDGPFVNLGGAPVWLMGKGIDSASRNWFIMDTVRSPENPVDDWLLVDDSGAEATNALNAIDFVSNGNKLRGSASLTQAAETYIYLAFVQPNGPIENTGR